MTRMLMATVSAATMPDNHHTLVYQWSELVSSRSVGACPQTNPSSSALVLGLVARLTTTETTRSLTKAMMAP